MKRLVLTAALLASCSPATPEEKKAEAIKGGAAFAEAVVSFHDARHRVTCWGVPLTSQASSHDIPMSYSAGYSISCLPDEAVEHAGEP